MNDPNGPIWWKGQYHLFYQLNPHAAVWGDMHWGHAMSPDMVHWHHEPVALAPTPGGPDSEGCFSGSAVVFKGVPTFMYTGVQKAPPDQVTIRDGSSELRETQMLATAEDDGLRRWKKVETPVIAAPPASIAVTGFRDPCLWQEADGWYLGLGSGERGKGGCVLLYRSQDLRHWDYLHPLTWGKPNGKQAANPCDSGEMWECPDFFELGHSHCLNYSTEDKTFWATGDYGPRDHTFTPKQKGVLDRGRSWYAPKSFLAPDGRRILWGWLRETRPEAEFSAAGWSGCMSLPRVLTVDDHDQLEMHPAHELEGLRGPNQKFIVTSRKPVRSKLPGLNQEALVLIGPSQGSVGIRLNSNGATAWELTIDVTGNAVRCGEISFPLPDQPWPQPGVRIFIDASVIECFLGGREVLTSRVYTLHPDSTELEIEATGEREVQVDLWELRPISPDRLTT